MTLLREVAAIVDERWPALSYSHALSGDTTEELVRAVVRALAEVGGTTVGHPDSDFVLVPIGKGEGGTP